MGKSNNTGFILLGIAAVGGFLWWRSKNKAAVASTPATAAEISAAIGGKGVSEADSRYARMSDGRCYDIEEEKMVNQFFCS